MDKFLTWEGHLKIFLYGSTALLSSPLADEHLVSLSYESSKYAVINSWSRNDISPKSAAMSFSKSQSHIYTERAISLLTVLLKALLSVSNISSQSRYISL